ncbi:MAG: TonB-dependent receptor [Planctomycetota bacterium]|jgi:outer membrane receptor protein involved in Fe transport
MKHTTKAPFPVRKTVIAAALAAISTQALAQAQEQLVLEEVVVTAQKRESTIQDIAATVNVVTGDSIDRFSSLGFADLEAQTAGLSLATPNARSQTIAMRGVSVDAEAGVDATVTVYFNDQLVTNNIAFGQLYDLERVEVLRGPQGALQGRSSPAGAINIHSRSADLFEADGYIQGTVGDNEGFNGQVAYGMPLIEGVLGARVAAVYDTSNARDVENKTTGLDDPELEATSYRINTVWQITDNLVADLTYQNFDRDVDDPQGISGVDSLGERPTLKPEDKISLAPTNNDSEFDYDYINLQLNWTLGELDLASVTGWSDETRDYREENDRANYSQFQTPGLEDTFQFSSTEQEIFIQELRLSSSDNDFWDWMLGAYYQDQDVSANFIRNTPTTLPDDTPVLGDYTFSTFTDSDIPVESEQWSIFTFNTFYLTQTVQLEAGLRYTDYEKYRQATITLTDSTFPDTGFPPPLNDLILDGLKANVFGAFPGEDEDGNPVLEGVPEEFQDIDDDSWTGALTLRWDWTDDISLYANYSRGYRTKGNSIVPTAAIQFLPNPADYLLHDEEESDSFEIGMKGRFWDGRASLNAAVFYQKYDGYLGFTRGVEVLDDQGQPQVLVGGLIFNGDADVTGIEFDGQVLLAETWSAGGGLTYTNAEWDGAEQPCNDREPGEVVGTCDLDGENVGGEPEWSATFNTEYYYPLENTEVYIRGLYKFTGERDNISASAGIGAVTDEFNSYNLVDLFVGWRSSDYTWDVNVFAKNLFDEDELILQDGPDQFDQRFSGGSYTATNILQERTIGLMARYNF